MGKFFKEFKEFINRGNVMDMAVGVIIATAFGKITTSLVNDVFMPFISFLIGTPDMDALNITIREAVPEVLDAEGNVVEKAIEAISLNIGTFIGTVIDFILVALIVFLVIRTINRAKDLEKKLKKEQDPEPAAPTTKKCPFCCSEIAIEATRCPHCTSELPTEE